jgi:hypothetical protein
MNLVAGDIWYNSSDAHRISFFFSAVEPADIMMPRKVQA